MTQEYRQEVDRTFADLDKAADDYLSSDSIRHQGSIYHYTNDAALFEILRSGHLWMTDFSRLNDPKEIEYGLSIGCEVLRTAGQAAGHVPNLNIFVDCFEELVAKGAPEYLKAFVLSMSTSSDELSQWRAYAANGSGYCLEFSSEQLEQAFLAFGARLGGSTGSFLVQYDARALEIEMQKLAAIAVRFVTSCSATWTDHHASAFSRVSAKLLAVMTLLSLHFKHPAYKLESEHRYLAVFGPRRDVAHSRQRARGHQVLDYLEFDWKSAGSLLSIRSGPVVPFDRARSFLTQCVSLCKLSQTAIGIEHSTIPYRG